MNSSSCRRRLNHDQVRRIRASHDINISQLSNEFGVTRAAIRKIRNGETYKEKVTITTCSGLKRRCSKCKYVKDLNSDNFYMKYGKFGYNCKECHKKITRVISKRNRETIRILKASKVAAFYRFMDEKAKSWSPFKRKEV